MDSNTCNTLQSLSVAGASRVQVGNNYNTTHNCNGESDQDDTKKLLESLRSTDPRHDKKNIEQTNNHLLREAYVWILQNPEFLSWRDKNHDSQLLWIRGDPGKGKTMLLCGIIDELRPSTRLENSESHISLSYFFCQATNSALNNATAVIRGLIYLLVVQQPCLLSHLRANIHWDSRVAIEELFRKIVADPVLEEAYLIVDALDECREDLEFLLEILSSPIPRIKWIVSSRNRLEVEGGLEQSSSKLALSLEINEESVSQAVEYFVNHRTDELAKSKKLKNDETQQIKRYLTQNAHGTFLWVGLVCQHLHRCEAWEISGQLSQSQLPMGLNELYATMMMQILASNSREQYIGLLAIVSTVFRPLTFSELKAMTQLEFDEQRLLAFIRQCGSFLTTRGATVIFVHQSAKDFLMKESSELLFQFGLAQHHYALFQRSIHILEVLHKDMYNLEYPGVSLDEAIRSRPNPDPLDSLVYALVFWTDHICEACQLSLKGGYDIPATVIDTVYQFLSKTFLFWLEALSLCHNASVAGNALLSFQDLSANSISEPTLLELIEDALRFLHLFQPVIETHPLQIYTSGLLFSPQKSIILNLFKESTPSFIERVPKVDENWSPNLGVFEAPTESLIQTMNFSPKGDMVVMTTSDSQLLMWNVKDGYVHKDSRYNYAQLLTPSPDLQLLAFITTQNTLEVCELNSGNTYWAVTLNNPHVQAMEFASDSLWLAVCCEENLYLYAREGKLCQSWTLGAESIGSEPYKLSFSSNCDLLLCFRKGHGGHITVFDMRTGVRYKFPGLLAAVYSEDDNEYDSHYISEGLYSYIAKAEFVPNASLVVISDQKMGVFCWDFPNMECKESTLFEELVFCITDSHAECWVAISNFDEIHLIDRHSGIVMQKFDLHNRVDHPKRIQVSYDNKTIAVRSERTAWLFDAQTGLADEPKKRSHCILNDGVTIASHDDVTTIEVENPITEVTYTLDIRNNIDGHVEDDWMVLSPKGQLFAYSNWSTQGQALVYIWDLKRDHLRFRIEVSNKVKRMVISPSISNGDQWLAMCTLSKVLVWDVNTTQFHRSIDSPEDLGWHCEEIFCYGTWMGVLWVCPTGGRLVSHRADLFVRYDIKTGQQLSQMNIPDSYRSSLSPNGKWLVSDIFEDNGLLLSDIEEGINCAVIRMIRTLTYYFSFIDDSALWTKEGVLSFDSVLDNLINKSETGNSQILEIDGQVAQELPVVIPLIDEYGYNIAWEWITFDGRPLIWLPQQYRCGYDERKPISVGHHHVISHYVGGIYCIAFKHDAVNLLRQAISVLSI